jgi:hypothetical protein
MTGEKERLMKAFFKKLFEGWKKFAEKLAVVQTKIILFIIYFIFFGIISLFAFILRQDLLNKRLAPVKSYWKKKEHPGHMENQYKHQF